MHGWAMRVDWTGVAAILAPESWPAPEKCVTTPLAVEGCQWAPRQAGLQGAPPARGMNSKQEKAEESQTRQSRPTVRWGRIVLITCAALFLLLAGVITAFFTVESMTLKPIVERIVTVLIDRPFILEGDFEAELGRHITVRVDGIKIGNGVWSSEPYMLTVDQPYAALDLWALTRGQILIRDAKVKSGRLLFELSPEGKLNWELGEDSPDKEPAGPRLQSIPLLIEQADINDVHITLDLPAFEQSLEIQVDSAKLINGDNDVLGLVIAGSINEKPVNISGHIGPFTTLIVGGAVDFDLDVDLHTFELDAKGHIDDLVEPKQPEFELVLKGPEAAEFTSLLGLPEVTQGPVALQASMRLVADEFKVNVNGDFGEFHIDLTATLQALNTIDGLKLDVDASGPDLSVPAALIGLGQLPQEAYQLTGQVEESNGQLIIRMMSLEAGANYAYLDGVIPQFPKLAGATLKASVKGSNYLKFREILRLAEGPSLPEAFEIDAALQPGDGGQQTVNVTGRVGEINGQVNGTLGALPDFHGTRFDFELTGPDTKKVAEAFGVPGIISAPFDARGNVEMTPEGIQFRNTTAQVGRNRLEIDGLLGYVPLAADTNIDLRYVGDNLDEVMAMAGMPEVFPEVDYDVSARLIAVKDGIQVRMQASVGSADITASGIVNVTEPLQGTDLRISAKTPELLEFIPQAYRDYPIPGGAFEVSGRVRTTAGGLRLDRIEASLGTIDLELSGTVGLQDSLAGTDLEISVSGTNLAAAVPTKIGQDLDLPHSPFSLSGEVALSDSNLFVRRLKYTAAKGSITGNIELMRADPMSEGRFALEAKGPNFDAFVPNTLTYEPAALPFDITVRGAWNPDQVLLEDISAKIGSASIDIVGVIDRPPDVQATSVVLKADGPSLASLGSINGKRLPDKAFDLHATLDGNQNVLRIERMTAHLGDSDLTGQFFIDLTEKPTVIIKFDSKFLDLGQFMDDPVDAFTEAMAAAIDAELVDQESGAEPTDAAKDGSRLIPDLTVPIEALNRLNLSLHIDAGEVIFSETKVSKFDADVTLEDGKIDVDRFSANTAQGNFHAIMTLDTQADPPELSVSLVGSNMAFGFGGVDADATINYPLISVALDLKSTGTGSREIAANLNGYVDMISKPGQMPNSIILNIFGDFLNQLLVSINPFMKKEPYTGVVCGAYFIDVNDGIVSIDPGAVMQTDKMNIFASGVIDLNTEKLNVKINTAVRKGIGVSAGGLVNPFIRIRGTMANPRLVLDAKGIVVEGGVAVATLGLSIVAKSMYGRWFASKDPCGKFVEAAKKQGRFIDTVGSDLEP